ncbi:cysteine desulfurase family protein [Emcibacter sp. SYSU 3D8]|uniref:cysteine desulfurase family protein n=1 Tax=Emcibacter sp. SYSU 3D8 TaxID=3133969 RepID=UPI0031FE8FAF
MTSGFTYLDYNATAPVRPEVAAAVAEALVRVGNPSSVHKAGRAARAAVEQARARVAALVGARVSEVVFTSGGSEANMAALTRTGAARLIISAIEHDSVTETAAAGGLPVQTMPVDSEGVVDLAALERLLAEAPRDGGTLISLMLANNETGVIEPVARAAAIARRYGARLHCDAVQAAGKIPVGFNDLDADYLTLSAHKLGGPQGVGALVVREICALTPLVSGGGQEQGRRSGTENVPGIVGFGVAAELAGLPADTALLRDAWEDRVRTAAPEAVILSASASRLANTSCVALPGAGSETQVMALDLAGIGISAGAACSSGKVRTSRVLSAMGCDADVAGSAIRVSLGWGTTEADMDRLFTAWAALHRRMAQRKAG